MPREKKPQREVTPEEMQERKEELRTQGRKGCKAVRITMAFTPQNHRFIQVMAKASGKSQTQVVNNILQAYQNGHPELMQQAQGFIDFMDTIKEW